jgi:phosphoglycolate phosphatase-like HAD superfamily hydrolase
MRAVIFDIDGTLLRSDEIDGELYTQAIRDVLGNVELRGTWSDYTNVSDSGILAEVATDNAINTSDHRVALVQQRFVELIEQHIAKQGPFAEVPGARRFVSSLHVAEGCEVAYATGGWRASATLKLASAKFPLRGIPLATSDDFPQRANIMKHALSQLGGGFESVTYYGDGVWDRAAAGQLGWHFVPVGDILSGLRDFGSAVA